jgi:hypothetical protein
MKTACRMFKRGSVFYAQNNATRKQESFQTEDRQEAEKLKAAKSAAESNRFLSLALARKPAAAYWSEYYGALMLVADL